MHTAMSSREKNIIVHCRARATFHYDLCDLRVLTFNITDARPGSASKQLAQATTGQTHLPSLQEFELRDPKKASCKENIVPLWPPFGPSLSLCLLLSFFWFPFGSPWLSPGLLWFPLAFSWLSFGFFFPGQNGSIMILQFSVSGYFELLGSNSVGTWSCLAPSRWELGAAGSAWHQGSWELRSAWH